MNREEFDVAWECLVRGGPEKRGKRIELSWGMSLVSYTWERDRVQIQAYTWEDDGRDKILSQSDNPDITWEVMQEQVMKEVMES